MPVTRAGIGVMGAIVALAMLSGCAAPQSQTLIATAKRMDTPAFLDATRSAASPDGVVSRASDDELVAAAMRICFPTEDDSRAGITVGDVVVPDRADLDALMDAAHLYVCS